MSGDARSDRVRAREPRDVVGRAKGERLNRHRRLAAARGDEAASVADEEVRHVVRAMVAVDDGVARIVAHPRRAEQMHATVARKDWMIPDLRGTAAVMKLLRAVRNHFAMSSGWSVR